MSRNLTAREVAHILGVSSKTVREWANDGVLKGLKTDDGPGKETWEFSEDDIYLCTDKRVVNRLRPEKVSERQNAQQRIDDLEREVEGLKASLHQAEEALQSERDDREGILEKTGLLHQQEVAELKKTADRYEEACFAFHDAMDTAIQSISLKGNLERLFRDNNIKVIHRMDEDLDSWNLLYAVQSNKITYHMPEFRYVPESRYEALNRHLLKTEAGDFRGCRKPSKERLQARRVLYGLRLRVLAPLLLLFLLLLMALGRVTQLPALILISLGVTALVVVDSVYRVRIWIKKRREA